MRLRLDDGKSYDLLALFQPRRVGMATAWRSFRANLSAWPRGLAIPFTAARRTLRGTLSWLLFMPLHTLSLMLLPLLVPLGLSFRAYSYFTPAEAAQLQDYRAALQTARARLRHIEDPEEYKRRLSEEIKRIKPYR